VAASTTSRYDRPRMDPAQFTAAGLYDPTAPNAAARLAFLDWLASRGVTIEQMIQAERETSLTALASDLSLRSGPRLSARDVARRHDLTVEQVLALSLAAGLSPQAPDDPMYVEEDAALFASFVDASKLFGEAATRRFIRVVGSSVARIAEAAITLYQVNVEGPLRASGGSELELATKNVRATDLLAGVREMLQGLLGGHMERATRLFREARSRYSADTVTLGVGFVDLVGFTPLAHRMPARELAEVIERFEDAAYDIATARDGRVVKLIGDEVMFVTRDPGAACDIALTLIERFAGDPAVTPRGGLAHGELLQRGGDYYGPIVNLASRVAQIAVPNELLVTRDLAATAARSSALRFEPAGKRMLKGLDDPVPLLTVARG